MEIPHIQVPGLAPKCQFVCSKPIPDMLEIRIARGSPQLFSNPSLAIFTCLVSERLFWNVCPSAYHQVPSLPRSWRRVRRNLAPCRGKAWKAKVVDKIVPSKWIIFQPETICESVARMHRRKPPRKLQKMNKPRNSKMWTRHWQHCSPTKPVLDLKGTPGTDSPSSSTSAGWLSPAIYMKTDCSHFGADWAPGTSLEVTADWRTDMPESKYLCWHWAPSESCICPVELMLD